MLFLEVGLASKLAPVLALTPVEIAAAAAAAVVLGAVESGSPGVGAAEQHLTTRLMAAVVAN